jgi:integrase
MSASTVTGYMKPLSGSLALAVRRGHLAANPYRNLMPDERPRQRSTEPAHKWSDEEIEALLATATKLAQRRDSRHDYTPILRLAVNTGLRHGELLGLQWGEATSISTSRCCTFGGSGR